MFYTPAYLKDAKERRRLLDKVYFYRRHQLDKSSQTALIDLSRRFQQALRAKDRALLETLSAQSHQLLTSVGAHYYRHYHFFENIETFVVAAILAIGIRSYFLQPFKIPTNSMWPTYHGMTYTFTNPAQPPTALSAAAGFIFQGVTQHTLTSPVQGELSIPVFDAEERAVRQAAFYYRSATQNFLGFIPIPVRRYLFYVGQTPLTLDVPNEFSLDKLLMEKFFSSGGRLNVRDGRVYTGVQVGEGESPLSFQIETGDMLFVDRLSYNLFPPRVGQPIVFRTRGVPGLTRLNDGRPDDKYYIKRLVGLPGDTLQIKDNTIYRNSAPISGSPIFAINSALQPPYRGYQAQYDFENGQTHTVPDGNFYAFGDNSSESLDSRVWGGLPKDQLVGRAVFIYYPFTSRWGFSR